MAGVKTWSRTAASNVLANIGYTLDENMAPSAVNDSMRAVLADIKSEWSQATAVASASTPDITIATSGAGTLSGGYLHITGTTTITGFATADAGIRRRVVFDGALQLTHNATSFILLSGANITTAAGDCAEFVSEGSGNWRMTGYERASGAALVATTSPFSASFTSSDQTITAAGALTLAHSLGSTPTLIQAWLVAQNSVLGYTAGDITPAYFNESASFASRGCSVVPDATNLNVRFGSDANTFAVVRKDTGVGANVTNTDWKIRFRAWK